MSQEVEMKASLMVEDMLMDRTTNEIPYTHPVETTDETTTETQDTTTSYEVNKHLCTFSLKSTRSMISFNLAISFLSFRQQQSMDRAKTFGSSKHAIKRKRKENAIILTIRVELSCNLYMKIA